MARPGTVAVIGGGLVGLATARALLRAQPGLSLTLFEKEPAVAAHQSGRNSGVIHSGVYYKPGSLKAMLCVQGARALVAFCREHGIPTRLSGKVIVAVRPEEQPALRRLHEQAQANGVEGTTLVGPERLRELEPHAQGVAALHVPSAGVVDYRAVAQRLAELVTQAGGSVRLGTPVTGLRRDGSGWRVLTAQGDEPADLVVACAGLQADRVAAWTGTPRTCEIVPFRGEYYDLDRRQEGLVRSMIYPVPEPGVPFLGVHFTKGIEGHVHVGPNAVLALQREGYRRGAFDAADAWALARSPAAWRLAARQWRLGARELIRSRWKPAFVRQARRLLPTVQGRDLRPAGCGVRAQAVDRAGRLVDDFDIAAMLGALLVRNVPSPAATACLAIGEHVATMAQTTRPNTVLSA